MYWQFDTGFVSQIDTILDKEDVTLRELMDEDDILQECKAQNQKLINFLIRPIIIEEMLLLITTEPPEDVEEKTRFKYANLACELLTSDVVTINDALVSNETVLNKLYNFINTDNTLNPLLASFYSKTMSLLFSKKTDIMFEFLKTKEDFVTLLLKHLNTSAIMDLLLKLVTNVDNTELRIVVVKWLHERNLIQQLVGMFKNEFKKEQQNAAQLLCDIVKASREHQALLQEKAIPDPLLDDIESTTTVTVLLNNMLSSQSETTLVSGLSVLQSLLEYKRHCLSSGIQISTANGNGLQAAEFEGMPQCYVQPMLPRGDIFGPEQMSPLDAERLSKGVSQVQAAIIPKLDEFHSLLLNPPQKQPIRTTIGEISIPLGSTRLEIAHLITALLSSNNPAVSEKLAALETIPVLVRLFFQYPWNNFLHTQVQQTLNCVLNNYKTNAKQSSQNSTDLPQVAEIPDISSSLTLVHQLFNQCNLIETLINTVQNNICNSNNSTNMSTSKTHRAGYMGHVIKIANAIKEMCDEEFLQNSLSPDVYSKWTAFVNETLSEITKQMRTPLVNEMPSVAGMNEDARRQQENALQQAFIEYQMQQMTRNICSQIGFAASEFTELSDSIQPQVDQITKIKFTFENQMHEQAKGIDIFEQMCAERMKGSVDSNSSDEEDLWEDRDMSFAHSSIATQQMKQSEFSSFCSNTQQQDTGDKVMDVDRECHWESEIASSSVAPMDTSNPWANETKSGNNLSNAEGDSWADFSSFPADFSSTVDTSSKLVTATSTSGLSPLSSLEGTTSENLESTIPAEATNEVQGVENLHQVNSVSGAAKETLDTEEQENTVSSSSDANVHNGPC